MIKINGFVLLFCVFVVGFFVGIVFDRVPYLTLDSQVNIVELCNLVFLFFIVFAVPVFFQSKIDNHKTLKQLLISDIDGLCDDLSEIKEIISDSAGKKLESDMLAKVNYTFKKSRRRLGTICEEVVRFDDALLNERVELIINDVTDYWDMITGNKSIANLDVETAYILKQEHCFLEIERSSKLFMYTINNI